MKVEKKNTSANKKETSIKLHREIETIKRSYQFTKRILSESKKAL